MADTWDSWRTDKRRRIEGMFKDLGRKYKNVPTSSPPSFSPESQRVWDKWSPGATPDQKKGLRKELKTKDRLKEREYEIKKGYPPGRGMASTGGTMPLSNYTNKRKPAGRMQDFKNRMTSNPVIGGGAKRIGQGVRNVKAKYGPQVKQAGQKIVASGENVKNYVMKNPVEVGATGTIGAGAIGTGFVGANMLKKGTEKKLGPYFKQPSPGGGGGGYGPFTPDPRKLGDRQGRNYVTPGGGDPNRSYVTTDNKMPSQKITARGSGGGGTSKKIYAQTTAPKTKVTAKGGNKITAGGGGKKKSWWKGLSRGRQNALIGGAGFLAGFATRSIFDSDDAPRTQYNYHNRGNVYHY